MNFLFKDPGLITTWLEDWTKKFATHFEQDVEIKFYNRKSEPVDFLHQARNLGQIAFYTQLYVSIAKKDKSFYSFTLETMPSCCGILVLQYLQLTTDLYTKRVPKAGTCSMLLDFVKDLAEGFGYSHMYCSMVTYDLSKFTISQIKANDNFWNVHKFQENLKNAGFIKTGRFTNKRTNNIIDTFHINL